MPDPDSADLSFEYEMDVRFGDFDGLGHVNHATFATYCEHARLRYLERVLDVSVPELRDGFDGNSLVIANLQIDYLRPIADPGTVTVAMGTTGLGESSIVMEYELRAGGSVVATAETTLVVVDVETGRSAPLPDGWRERIEKREDREF